MAKSEHRPWSLGLLASIRGIFSREATESEERLTASQPELGDLSGPSGLPAAPLRIEKRGL